MDGLQCGLHLAGNGHFETFESRAAAFMEELNQLNRVDPRVVVRCVGFYLSYLIVVGSNVRFIRDPALGRSCMGRICATLEHRRGQHSRKVATIVEVERTQYPTRTCMG